ncbi:hypothetical protein EON82_20720 [bacterium]|nr:MAG: hypothetical protein EON82_20720 [bacterium]
MTFAASPTKVLIPVREVANGLGIPFGEAKGRMVLGKKPLDAKGPELANGTRLIPLQDLDKFGVSVVWDAKKKRSKLYKGGKVLYVRRGQKRIFIDKARQQIRALQGGRTVMRSPVSTGAAAKDTPNGIFKVQPYRARLHKSKLYKGARMPYAVQIVGNIFVHGWQNFANEPRSNGCIRLPVTGANPALFFYRWADVGTPVVIWGKWRG